MRIFTGFMLSLLVVSGACTNETDVSGGNTSSVNGAASSPGVISGGNQPGSGGCGGEAAAGGYTKGGGTWDGTAGNAYGYPQGEGGDCAGFGFHDTCDFWESCSYYCSTDDECPSGGPGAPEPVCRVNPGFNSSFCVLPCDGDGASCPDGMQCVEHPYGFGEICLWKRSYGSP